MPAWRGSDTGKEADAAGKVTNYGDALLTESLQTVRTIQSHFFKLDAIIDEPQCACPSGDIPVPRWTITSSVAQTERVNPSTQHNQRPEPLKWRRYTSSFALWSQVRRAFVSYPFACRSLLMERMDRAPHWRAASSHPVRCYSGATDMLQCYNSLLLIAGKCLISFERVITSGGFTVCKQTRSTGVWWHCVIRGSCDCFCSGSDFGCVRETISLFYSTGMGLRMPGAPTESLTKIFFLCPGFVAPDCSVCARVCAYTPVCPFTINSLVFYNAGEMLGYLSRWG